MDEDRKDIGYLKMMLDSLIPVSSIWYQKSSITNKLN